MLDTNIILIGPLATGKSTIGKLLGAALNIPALELDDLRWSYYAEIGYDPEHAEQLRRAGGIRARGNYRKPFEIHSVKRMLQDYPAGYVLSFGAGNSVYDDPAHQERAERVLAPYPYIILLLPSTDVRESVHILTERFRKLVPECGEDDLKQVIELNRHFTENPANARLATYIVYTGDKSPAESCDDILVLLNLGSA
ncbi:MAG: shikimate kinase [Chloroflexota bacterium]